MRLEKKLDKHTKTNLGKRKNRIVLYAFIVTIVLSLAFSFFATWAFLGDNLGGDLCTYMGKDYQPQWHDIYSIVNDEVCILGPMAYFLLVGMFLYAFILLQGVTILIWAAQKFLKRKQQKAF